LNTSSRSASGSIPVNFLDIQKEGSPSLITDKAIL
jgi:hypothetical protein